MHIAPRSAPPARATAPHAHATHTLPHRVAPSTPTLNTILAVREHAPTEIQELDLEIGALHARLAAAHARKRLLEELLDVITRTDPEHQDGTSIAVLR